MFSGSSVSVRGVAPTHGCVYHPRPGNGYFISSLCHCVITFIAVKYSFSSIKYLIKNMIITSHDIFRSHSR